MRIISILLLVLGVAGCVTQPAGETSRSQASAKLRTELAAEYYSRAQFSVALEELKKALNTEPDYAPAFGLRALVYMALHEDRNAEDDFLTSLGLDKLNSDTHSNYGWFLCQREREAESVNQFMAALKNPLYATPEKAFLNAGICSNKAGKIIDAEEFLKKALLLQPDMREAQLEMAELNFTKGDYAVAKSFFTRFVRSAADNLTAPNLWLGVRIERKLGDNNAEESYAMQLRKRFPDSRETQLVLQGQ